MAMEVTGLDRVFKFKKGSEIITLPELNKDFTAQEVLQFYSMQHAELTTSTIDGPKVEGSSAVYEFKTTVGTKG